MIFTKILDRLWSLNGTPFIKTNSLKIKAENLEKLRALSFFLLQVCWSGWEKVEKNYEHELRNLLEKRYSSKDNQKFLDLTSKAVWMLQNSSGWLAASHSIQTASATTFLIRILHGSSDVKAYLYLNVSPEKHEVTWTTGLAWKLRYAPT